MVKFIRMIEVVNGKIEHKFDDGLYMNAGDVFEFIGVIEEALETDEQDGAASLVQSLLTELQKCVLGRKLLP